MIQKYKINGMTCGGCAHNVEGILSEIDGVISAKVDLANQTADIVTKDGVDLDIRKYFEGTKYQVIKE